MVTGYTPQVALGEKTTFNTGGVAEYFATATSEAELQTLLQAAAEAKQPVTILGGGSNMLVADAGVPGCVIEIAITGREVLKQEHDEVVLMVGAGEVLDEVVAHTVREGWWGLENLSAIPGSVGATPIQNVGAYGVEVAQYIEAVQAVHKTTGEQLIFSASECAFGYRDSWFKTEAGREWVITHVTFVLNATPQPKLTYKDLTARFGDTSPTQLAIREAIIEIRGQKFPDWSRVGTAGSFFKNPTITTEQYEQLQTQYPDLPGFVQENGLVKVSLGWILDKVCNLRGYHEGAVGCYEGQALVLVQTGGATTSDVQRFAGFVAEQVQEKTGITIEWEVTPVG